MPTAQHDLNPPAREMIYVYVHVLRLPSMIKNPYPGECVVP
jgi:hypothetical protein